MTFCYPEVNGFFDTDSDRINTLVIENQSLFLRIVYDIFTQIEGNKGISVIGNGGDKLLEFSKYAELITSFVDFDINKKSLISKIISAVDVESQNAYLYDKTMALLTYFENYMTDITSSFNCNLSFSKISSSSLIKSAGIEIVDDYLSFAEKIIDYIELVREFERDKLFFIVNLRSYISDIETENFLKTALMHKYNIIMIENKDYNNLKYEKRCVIDSDLCEI